MIRPCKHHMTKEVVYEVWLGGDRYGLTYKTRKEAKVRELKAAREYLAGDSPLMKWLQLGLDKRE